MKFILSLLTLATFVVEIFSRPSFPYLSELFSPKSSSWSAVKVATFEKEKLLPTGQEQEYREDHRYLLSEKRINYFLQFNYTLKLKSNCSRGDEPFLGDHSITISNRCSASILGINKDDTYVISQSSNASRIVSLGLEVHIKVSDLTVNETTVYYDSLFKQLYDSVDDGSFTTVMRETTREMHPDNCLQDAEIISVDVSTYQIIKVTKKTNNIGDNAFYAGIFIASVMALAIAGLLYNTCGTPEWIKTLGTCVCFCCRSDDKEHGKIMPEGGGEPYTRAGNSSRNLKRNSSGFFSVDSDHSEPKFRNSGTINLPTGYVPFSTSDVEGRKLKCNLRVFYTPEPGTLAPGVDKDRATIDLVGARTKDFSVTSLESSMSNVQQRIRSGRIKDEKELQVYEFDPQSVILRRKQQEAERMAAEMLRKREEEALAYKLRHLMKKGQGKGGSAITAMSSLMSKGTKDILAKDKGTRRQLLRSRLSAEMKINATDVIAEENECDSYKSPESPSPSNVGRPGAKTNKKSIRKFTRQRWLKAIYASIKETPEPSLTDEKEQIEMNAAYDATSSLLLPANAGDIHDPTTVPKDEITPCEEVSPQSVDPTSTSSATSAYPVVLSSPSRMGTDVPMQAPTPAASSIPRDVVLTESSKTKPSPEFYGVKKDTSKGGPNQSITDGKVRPKVTASKADGKELAIRIGECLLQMKQEEEDAAAAAAAAEKQRTQQEEEDDDDKRRLLESSTKGPVAAYSFHSVNAGLRKNDYKNSADKSARVGIVSPYGVGEQQQQQQPPPVCAGDNDEDKGNNRLNNSINNNHNGSNVSAVGSAMTFEDIRKHSQDQQVDDSREIVVHNVPPEFGTNFSGINYRDPQRQLSWRGINDESYVVDLLADEEKAASQLNVEEEGQDRGESSTGGLDAGDSLWQGSVISHLTAGTAAGARSSPLFGKKSGGLFHPGPASLSSQERGGGKEGADLHVASPQRVGSTRVVLRGGSAINAHRTQPPPCTSLTHRASKMSGIGNAPSLRAVARELSMNQDPALIASTSHPYMDFPVGGPPHSFLSANANTTASQSRLTTASGVRGGIGGEDGDIGRSTKERNGALPVVNIAERVAQTRAIYSQRPASPDKAYARLKSPTNRGKLSSTKKKSPSLSALNIDRAMNREIPYDALDALQQQQQWQQLRSGDSHVMSSNKGFEDSSSILLFPPNSMGHSSSDARMMQQAAFNEATASAKRPVTSSSSSKKRQPVGGGGTSEKLRNGAKFGFTPVKKSHPSAQPIQAPSSPIVNSFSSSSSSPETTAAFPLSNKSSSPSRALSASKRPPLMILSDRGEASTSRFPPLGSDSRPNSASSPLVVSVEVQPALQHD